MRRGDSSPEPSRCPEPKGADDDRQFSALVRLLQSPETSSSRDQLGITSVSGVEKDTPEGDRSGGRLDVPEEKRGSDGISWFYDREGSLWYEGHDGKIWFPGLDTSLWSPVQVERAMSPARRGKELWEGVKGIWTDMPSWKRIMASAELGSAAVIIGLIGYAVGSDNSQPADKPAVVRPVEPPTTMNVALRDQSMAQIQATPRTTDAATGGDRGKTVSGETVTVKATDLPLTVQEYSPQGHLMGRAQPITRDTWRSYFLPDAPASNGTGASLAISSPSGSFQVEAGSSQAPGVTVTAGDMVMTVSESVANSPGSVPVRVVDIHPQEPGREIFVSSYNNNAYGSQETYIGDTRSGEPPQYSALVSPNENVLADQGNVTVTLNAQSSLEK